MLDSRVANPLAAHHPSGRGHDGSDGNEALTALTGATLLVLLAIIGVSIVRIRQLMFVHLFVGLLLIGPIALKLASTGYRFRRYYAGDREYRQKGPPVLALRLIAPVVVVSTLVVFVSGPELPGLAAARAGRGIALAGVLVAGIVLSVALIPDFTAWTHGVAPVHGGH